jgi:hypothetical protein
MVRRVWTFEREKRRLSLERDEGNASLSVVTAVESPRQYRFDDLPSLIRFQTDMEKFLLRTGWAFVGFSPEARRGRDRRGFPRIRERRRWWTDGSKPMHKVVWGG